MESQNLKKMTKVVITIRFKDNLLLLGYHGVTLLSTSQGHTIWILSGFTSIKDTDENLFPKLKKFYLKWLKSQKVLLMSPVLHV